MRLFRLLILFSAVFFFLWASFALFSADTFIAEFQSKAATLSPVDKKIYYKQVLSSITLLAIRNRNDVDQAKLYESLKSYVSDQIQSIGLIVSSGMSISNVDLVKVRNTWLALHNTERITKWLTPFVYSSVLEWTATTWAQHLADIHTTTHLRKSTDGYYSYASIKDWFVDQWIFFATQEKNGEPLFTENIWWNIYSCKKTDCTDDFIKAIKKAWIFFMSEKWKSYKPHYNAIVWNFSSLGLGVVITGNKYYLVSHYTQALK